MTKTEDTIALLEQLIKHLKAGSAVVDCQVSRNIGEPIRVTVAHTTYREIVNIRIEYEKAN